MILTLEWLHENPELNSKVKQSGTNLDAITHLQNLNTETGPFYTVACKRWADPISWYNEWNDDTHL